MKLHEYQSKQIFARYGIPIPEGEVAATPQEARALAERLGPPVVIKAQVLVGGRGKAGGIQIARTPQEAEDLAARILSLQIKGLPVRKVLVARAVDIRQEIYLGIVVDRVASRPVMMASAEGGVDIEEVARTKPEAIQKVHIDPFVGLRNYQTLWLAKSIGLPAELHRDFGRIAQGLYRSFVDCDASLAEINPLVITPEGTLLALDAKIVLDDNGLFRHPDLAAMRDVDEETPSERAAREAGLSFVQLDGDIGCMVNGAGLAMATMDIIQHFGGMPANFLDIGGGARADRVAVALRLILADPKVKAILFNIFGGITRCDEVARGIVSVLEELRPDLPIVARLVGTNEEEGRRILETSGFRIQTARTLAEAAQKAVAAARGA
ncbi:MAG: ADP-forming succinate--CoA ligase subunit beta [Anaerolineae bacterium]|nr:ADP-forming succinate--CoA ligase subunit beta [Anaerolineae bacterium]MCX8067969.1 ADP-forming succinate--CoA ligase subunit beta [Anaerolineae bacterium]MDW7991990.1 ADP-forming succinate--CoA ligase subunit beta [Anaerolineae bacterium]